MQKYLERYRPDFAWSKNVCNLDAAFVSEDGVPLPSSLQLILEELRALGYICDAFTLLASSYMLPQGRKRIYIWAVDASSEAVALSSAAHLRREMSLCMEALKIPALPLGFFCLQRATHAWPSATSSSSARQRSGRSAREPRQNQRRGPKGI